MGFLYIFILDRNCQKNLKIFNKYDRIGLTLFRGRGYEIKDKYRKITR